MKKLLFTLFLTGMSVLSFAQFKIHSDGKISINTTETPNSPISLNHAGNADFYMSYQGPNRFLYAATNEGNLCSSFILRPSASQSFSIASQSLIYPFTPNNPHAISVGAMGVTKGVPYGIGVMGYLRPPFTAGAGVVGCRDSITPGYTMFDQNYAGLFLGDVKVTSNLKVGGSIYGTIVNPSAPTGGSASLIEASLDRGFSTLDCLSTLGAYAYRQENRAEDMKAELTTIQVDDSTTVTLASADDGNYIGRQSAENTHYALDAEQLEKAFPGLVYEMADGTKTINYVEMVPLLVQGINELNARILQLESDNARLTHAATAGAGSSPFTQAVLYQNTPNPFTAQTEIRFSLSEGAHNAYIYIFDMTGKTLKQIPVTPEQNSITIQGYELNSGIYLYSLVVNGQEIDTKRMILSK